MAPRRGRLAAVVAVLAVPAAAAAAPERPAPRLLGHLYGGTTASYAPRFLFDSDHFAAHYTERADRSLFDLPTSRRTRLGVTVDEGTVTGTVDGGNAAAEFQRFARARVAMVDSFARPFAYLVQRASDPESVEVLTERGEPYDVTFAGPAPGNANGALTPAVDPTKLVLQGLGCMAAPALRTRYAIVGMESGNATAPSDRANPPDVGAFGHEIGVRGFVAVRDLPVRIAGVSTRRLLAAHDVGCAPRGFRAPAGAAAVRELPERQPWDRFGDLYLGSRSWKDCPVSDGRPDPESPDCGTPYAQYQSPAGLTPPGDGVSLLTANTTGVTGLHAGIVRAVYRAGAFRQVDDIGYADPNVPCAGPGAAGVRTAHWVFGDANPRPAPGQAHIWGWRVEREPAPPGGDWPAVTLTSSRLCGAPASNPAPALRAPLRRCPPAGARTLRSSRGAVIYAAGRQAWVCERRSRLSEELDDPATGERIQRGAALDLGRRALAEVDTDGLDDRLGRRRMLVVLDVAAYVGRAPRDGLVLEAPLLARAGSARLYRSGAAYIDCVAGPPRVCRVHVVTPGRPPRDRIVASGARIVPTSLRVRNKRLRWRVRR